HDKGEPEAIEISLLEEMTSEDWKQLQVLNETLQERRVSVGLETKRREASGMAVTAIQMGDKENFEYWDGRCSAYTKVIRFYEDLPLDEVHVQLVNLAGKNKEAEKDSMKTGASLAASHSKGRYEAYEEALSIIKEA
ncbi:hypothetical protein, partial [Bacillus mycoides]|uniref:hypothetical protein n=1 Tax=Bacillus mycoides TaxID=1405 RepID=UPI003A80886E